MVKLRSRGKKDFWCLLPLPEWLSRPAWRCGLLVEHHRGEALQSEHSHGASSAMEQLSCGAPQPGRPPQLWSTSYSTASWNTGSLEHHSLSTSAGSTAAVEHQSLNTPPAEEHYRLSTTTVEHHSQQHQCKRHSYQFSWFCKNQLFNKKLMIWKYIYKHRIKLY